MGVLQNYVAKLFKPTWNHSPADSAPKGSGRLLRWEDLGFFANANSVDRQRPGWGGSPRYVQAGSRESDETLQVGR